MRNLIKNAADILKEVIKVQPEFPKAKSVLPVATITEIYNSQLFTVDRIEWESEIAVQVDIWAETLLSCDELTLKADDAMRAADWHRDSAQGFSENSVFRKSLRYSMKIINLEKENQI